MYAFFLVVVHSDIKFGIADILFPKKRYFLVLSKDKKCMYLRKSGRLKINPSETGRSEHGGHEGRFKMLGGFERPH